jgi:hypothetical protein
MSKVTLNEVSELEYYLGNGDGNIAKMSLGGYTTVNMDPFPCYAHPTERVQQLVDLVVAKFPIGMDVHFYMPAYDSTARFNGCCWVNQDYSDQTSVKLENGDTLYAPKTAHILLAGKVIPLHPAMTRYLVPHEYGHAVEDWVAWRQRKRDKDLLVEYAKLRGLEPDQGKYVARNWHKTVGEIFANDFRIIVCGLEPEFWPHECERPEKNYGVIGFWQEALKLAAWPEDNTCSPHYNMPEIP